MKRYTKIILALLMAAVMFACTAIAAGATGVSGGDVSGSDSASSTDIAVEGGISTRETVDIKLKDFGFSITIPVLDSIITPETPFAEATATLGANTAEMMASQYLMYAMDEDQYNAYYLTYNVTTYTKSIGSYNKLSDEALAGIVTAASAASNEYMGYPTLCESREYNGQKWVFTGYEIETADEAGAPMAFKNYVLVTVANGVEYTLTVYCVNGAEADGAALDSMFNTMKLSAPGLGFAFEGNGVNIWMLVALIVVGVIALLLTFFIIRFSAYQKSMGSSFNIFGFDFPSAYDDDDEEYYDDDDEDDEDADDEDDN